MNIQKTIKMLALLVLSSFFLASCDSAGGGSPSSKIFDETSDKASDETSDDGSRYATSIGIPSDLSTITKNLVITLSWADVDGASYYQVYRHTASDSSQARVIAEPLVAKGTQYQDNQAVGKTTYYYWIKACDATECSSFSKVIEAKEVVAINDTGITIGGDYTAGNNSTCISNIDASQDCHQGYDVQNTTSTKVGSGEAGFDFTKLNISGVTLDSSATSWSCVRDNVTGLIWEVKTDDSNSIHYKDNTYRWGGITAIGSNHPSRQGTYYDATYDNDNGTSYSWDELVNGSNSNSLCGYSDWRVPTREELRSIVNYNKTNPSIDTTFFPNTSNNSFWSSSPVAHNDDNSWRVSFNEGLDSSAKRDESNRLRLVRGGQVAVAQTTKDVASPQITKDYIDNQWPDSRYIDNGDGTVTDKNTNLMWKKCSEGQSDQDCSTGIGKAYDWKQALERAKEINSSSFAGYNDWRVPNIKELASLVALDRYNPSINVTMFPNSSIDDYWTSSPSASSGTYSWNIYFLHGYDINVSSRAERDTSNSLRLVRSGQ